MIQTQEMDNLRWEDVSAPTSQELNLLSERYGFPEGFLKDTLESRHIPFGSFIDDKVCLFIRYADDKDFKVETADTTEELTHRLILIMGKDFVMSIHRHERPPITELASNATDRLFNTITEPKDRWLVKAVMSVIQSFTTPLQFIDDEFERFEISILEQRNDGPSLQNIYFLKRKAAVFKRVLRQNSGAIQWYRGERNFSDKKKERIQRIVEEAEKLFSKADELVEDTTHLLHSQIAMSAHNTNEVIRVLTLFSVFFMPLTFVAGVYGMNFRHMPELNWQYGYLFSLGLMATIAAGLYSWFRMKGWLRK